MFAGFLTVPVSAGDLSTGSTCADENTFLGWEAVLYSTAWLAFLTAVVGVIIALLLHKFGNAQKVKLFGVAIEFYDPPVAPDQNGAGAD